MRGSEVQIPSAAPVKSRRPEIYSGRFLFWLQFWLQTRPNRTFPESQSRTIHVNICTHMTNETSMNVNVASVHLVEGEFCMDDPLTGACQERARLSTPCADGARERGRWPGLASRRSDCEGGGRVWPGHEVNKGKWKRLL